MGNAWKQDLPLVPSAANLSAGRTMDFEDFHVAAVKETSDRIAEQLRLAGVRIAQRIVTAIGRSEHMIAVHPEDIDRAEQVFQTILGPGRTVTSDGASPMH